MSDTSLFGVANKSGVLGRVNGGLVGSDGGNGGYHELWVRCR